MTGTQLPKRVTQPYRPYHRETLLNRDSSENNRRPTESLKNRPKTQLISAPSTFPTEATTTSPIASSGINRIEPTRMASDWAGMRVAANKDDANNER